MEYKKLLIVTPELSYYTLKDSTRCKIIKVGGLADMVTTLVDSLKDKGINPYVAVPYFLCSGLDIKDFAKENLILVSDKRYSKNKSPYDKNIEEFSLAFQSRVLNEIIPGIKPDIIHAHDWPTSLIGPLAPPGLKSLFTIHNVHTKTIDIKQISDMNLSLANKKRLWLDDFSCAKVNLLMSGIFGSDYCNTPSERWLEEILSGDIPVNAPPGFWELIIQKEKNIVGILNSPDASYDPEIDQEIFPKYGVSDMLKGKLANKLRFQKEVGLESRQDSQLVVWTNRADANQKGIDILDNVLAKLIYSNPKLQIAIISDGDYVPKIKETISGIYSDGHRVVHSAFSDYLERNAYAAADGVLNFSRYAPCELVHMKGAKYGAIPIVRAIGGTAQTVYDHRSKETDSGVPGIITHAYTEESMMSLFGLFSEAVKSGSLHSLQKRTMEMAKSKYSPERMAEDYIGLYDMIIDS